MINNDLLTWANSYTGLSETTGTANNPVIMMMTTMLGVAHFKDDSTDEWCGLFLGFLAHVNGVEKPANFTIARNWLSVGAPVIRPIPGDVCVLWRGTLEGTDGHVGLYQGEDDTNVWLLGGNQVNSVRQYFYPKDRVLGYRRLFRK